MDAVMTYGPILRGLCRRAARSSAAALRLLCAPVILFAISACTPPAAFTFKAQADDEDKLRTARVQSGDFRITVEAAGRVVPNIEVEVTSKASGEILELPYEAGAHVDQGELLVRLDPEDELRNVAKQEAKLRAAVARREKAKKELTLQKSSYRTGLTGARAGVDVSAARLKENETRYKRQQQLYDDKLVPEQDLEAAERAYEEARLELIQARANVEETENQEHQIAIREEDVELAEVEVAEVEIALAEMRERLEETEVRSPMDGVITVRHVEPGMVISSAISNIGGGTLLLVVADLSRLYVVAAVDETDIGGVELGQPAEIKADAYAEETFEGRVYHIAPIGIEVSSVVTFDVKIEVVGRGLKRLRPGMTADVSIITAESRETFWVQSEAVQSGPAGDFVEQVRADGEPLRIAVQTGLTDGLLTEITGALAGGEELALRESTIQSAWERGEGANRPLKEGGPGGGRGSW